MFRVYVSPRRRSSSPTRRERQLVTAATLAVSCLAMTSAVEAQEVRSVAEERFDVDGDGRVDVIRLQDPPAVSIALAQADGSRPARTMWKPFTAAQGSPSAGTISVGSGKRYGDRTVIAVTASFVAQIAKGPLRGRKTTVGQAMILAWKRGTLEKLWEGPVGTRGREGGYRLHVEATPFGLIRYQQRADIHRCDGKPAYLFPEGFDFKQRRFRNVASPMNMPASATVLRAGTRAPTGAIPSPPVAFRTQSASTQAYANDAGDLVPPRELDDGDPRTVWREGTGGNGRGSFITITSPMSAPEILGLRIIPGDSSSKKAFYESNRLQRVGLLVGANHAFWIEFSTDPARQAPFDGSYWVSLPPGIKGACVTLVLDRVYPGRAAKSARAGDSAIAEIAVLTAMDLQPGGAEDALVDQVIAAGHTGDTAARLLVGRGARAVPPVVSRLEKGELSNDVTLRLRRILARIGDPRGAGQLVEGVATQTLSRGDKRMFRDALSRMGEKAIPALDGLLRDDKADATARVVAAQVLASIADSRARDALVRACGMGDRRIRKAVAVGLGRRALTDMNTLLQSAERAGENSAFGCESDLWRAIGLMARRGQHADKMRAAEALAARLGTAGQYELLYRLLDAAGGLSVDIAVESVHAMLERLSREPGARNDALRRIAAAALTENAHPDVKGVLISMVGDADPGVRERAMSGLGRRVDGDAHSDRVMIDGLRGDPWPDNRRTAASALASRCPVADDVRAALEQAVDRDERVPVMREALNALVTCRAPGIGGRLIAIAGDAKRPEKLRQRALTLVPMLQDPSLSPALIKLFSRLRSRAWSESVAVRLAAATAMSMGRMGTPDVVKPLMGAAREPSFPQIQAGAITGLGEMCPRVALPMFASLLNSSQRAVSVAARGAHNRCRRLRPTDKL